MQIKVSQLAATTHDNIQHAGHRLYDTKPFFLFTETIEKIKDLIKKGEELKAQELTGDQSLEILRDSLLIGFMVHHKLSEDQGPPGKPPRDAPLPKMLLHDPKMANVPRRMK